MIGVARSSLQYRPVPRDDDALRLAISRHPPYALLQIELFPLGKPELTRSRRQKCKELERNPSGRFSGIPIDRKKEAAQLALAQDCGPVLLPRADQAPFSASVGSWVARPVAMA